MSGLSVLEVYFKADGAGLSCEQFNPCERSTWADSPIAP